MDGQQRFGAKHKNKIIIGVSVLAALVVGVAGYTVSNLFAAGFWIGLEAEQSVSGNAKIINDVTASGGKAVVFNAPASGGGGGTTPPPASTDLHNATKKDIAMQLVSSAENSSLDWKAQYAYIEYNVEGNAAENRGYTAGIIGFTSKTHDMLELVRYYNQISPNNPLTPYTTALQNVDGTSSTTGLGTPFMNAWKSAANAADGKFKQAQDAERDRVYFNPAVAMAKADGVKALGQFAYYDAAVMHGPDAWGGGLPNIRTEALKKAKPPTQGGTEKTWLNAFLDARKAEMLREEGHSDTTRVDTMQRKFLNENNLDLNTPLSWSVYGDPYNIK